MSGTNFFILFLILISPSARSQFITESFHDQDNPVPPTGNSNGVTIIGGTNNPNSMPSMGQNNRQALGSLPNQCPYLEKSADARSLLTDVNRDIGLAISELQKKGDKCQIQGANLIGQMQSYNTAISQLAQQRVPNERAMTNLMVGSEPFPCGPDNREFTAFLSQYARGRVSEKMNVVGSGTGDSQFSDSSSSGLDGSFGEIIENKINVCLTPTGRTPSPQEMSELEVTRCTYQSLFGDGTGAQSRPGSWAANAWNNDCGTGSASSVSSAQTGIQKRQEDIETSRQNFETALNSVTDQFSTLSASISAIPDQQCAAAKQLLLGATQAGLGMTAALVGPWGAITSGFMSQILTSALQMAGTNQRKIYRLQKTEEALQNSNRTLFQNFSCHLFKTNQLNCELLTRSQLEEIETNQNIFDSCEKDSQVRSNLLMIGKLKNDLSAFSNGVPNPNQPMPQIQGQGQGGDRQTPNPNQRPSQPLPNPEEIDHVYNKFFSTKEGFGVLLPDGSHIPVYDYLYGTPNGLISKAVNNYQNLSSSDDRKNLKNSNVMEKATSLKNSLDDFDQKMKDFKKTGSFDTKGKTVVRDVIASVNSGEYIDALVFYLEERSKIEDTEDNKIFGIGKALSEEMKTTLENRLFEQLGPGIPKKKSESKDLRTTITDIYDQFLGDRSIIKDRYVNGHRKEAWKQIQDEFKNGVAIDKNGKETIKNRDMFSTNVVYAALTHCTLNYPFALNSTGTGLDEEYMKQCGFLKSCTGTNNSIGWPIDLNLNQQAKIKSHSVDEFGMCSMVNNFKSMENRLEKEFKKSGTICGKSVFEIESFR